MGKADVLEGTWWIGALAGSFLPDDLAAAMAALTSEGDSGVLVGLSPRALHGVRMKLTERNPSGFHRLTAEAVQDTLPLLGVEGWTFTWSGRVQRGLDTDTLTSFGGATVELRLRREFLGLGTTLKLPLDEEVRNEEANAKRIRAFVAALESLR